MSTALIVLCAALPLGDAEFIRGDANSDGAVSISDGHKILSYLFQGFTEPECMDAADFNDAKGINITDGIELIGYTLGAHSAPPAPFGAPGADPTTDDALDCGSYGNGDPLEDPDAALEVLEAVSAGEEGRATIAMAVSSSTEIAGYSGRIRLPPGVALDVEKRPRDLSGALDQGYMLAKLHGDSIHFGFLTSITEMSFMPPGRSVQALELTVCLEENLQPGEYPLVLEAGELVDFRSGRAIPPRLVSSKLTVTEIVAAGPECNPEVPPPERLPINAIFKLGDVSAPPGAEISVPFIIRADAEVQGFSYSIDFDETLLDARATEPVWQKPPGTDPEYGFSRYYIDNTDQVPGSGGIDEGFLAGAVVFALTEPVAMPRDTDNLTLRFLLEVKADAPNGTTHVRFLDGATTRGNPPIENSCTALGRSVTPSLAESFLLVDCRCQILPDGALFVRGDSNRDGTVNVSDPVNTLGHLFLGTGPLDCSDAADADDDGSLELADVIFTLERLFRGGPVLPPPNDAAGADPTPDGLYCFSRP